MKRSIIALSIGAFMALTVTHAAKPTKPVDELEARVEALEARPGPLQVLANGESIGFLTNVRHPGLTNLIYGVLSSTNYSFEVYVDSGDPANSQSDDITDADRLLFETEDCSSQVFVSVNSLRNIFGSEAQGAVFRIANSEDSLGHLYVPAGSVSAVRSFVANNTGGGCEAGGATNVDSVEAFPNDPTITGVPDQSFTPPITLRP